MLDVLAFNRQIEIAPPGTTITVPEGRYEIDSAGGLRIAKKHGITVQAHGRVELVSFAPDGDIVIIEDSDDIVVRGFTIYHDVGELECSASCIRIGESTSVRVERVDIHGSGAYGVGAWGHDNFGIEVVDSKIHDCTHWGLEIYSAGGLIRGNTMWNNGGPGGDRHIDIGDHEGIVIEDNVFLDRAPG